MSIINYLDVPLEALLITGLLRFTGVTSDSFWKNYLYVFGSTAIIKYSYPMIKNIIIPQGPIQQAVSNIGSFSQTSAAVQSASTNSGYRGPDLRPPFGLGLGFF